jgi:hypothetical protein
MSMYVRPPLRVKDLPRNTHDPVRIPDGSYLHNLIQRGSTVRPVPVRAPVYQKDTYLALLKKNYEECGLEYKEPDIPDYVERVRPQKLEEPQLKYADWVYMKVRILKSGIVRIKLDSSFAILEEKYYSQCKTPPLKSIIQAYKSMGFSEKFLDHLKKKYERKVTFGKKVGPAIDAIFNKEPAKKKKKPEIEQEVEEPVDDDDDVEMDEPMDDEGMDVEVEEDPDEQPQEDDEEAYISDGDA